VEDEEKIYKPTAVEYPQDTAADVVKIIIKTIRIYSFPAIVS